MANIFLNLPAPAGNAAGAGVDVSAMGASKSIVIAGSWGATITPIITIETNNDPAQLGSWIAIGSTQGGGSFEVEVCCKWMRARVANYSGGQAPTVNVGSDDGATTFAALDVPASVDGPGSWVDVSALPGFKTIQVGGTFQGAVIIEVSEDGANSSASLLSFQSATPGQQTLPYTAHWMRARRSGVPTIGPGTPVVNVGACNTGGGGAATVATDNTLKGDGVTPLGVVAPNQANLTNNEVGAVAPGTPVYVNASGGFKKAKADAATTTPVLGLTLAAVNPAAVGIVQFGGTIQLTTGQWDAICGTVGGLSFNVPYYLDAATAGKLTSVPPSTVGQVVQQVIIGITPTLAKIEISTPIVIGSGSNIIQLTNDAGAPMVIGTPVYSDAADGMNNGIANNTGKSVIVGLVADVNIAAGARGNVAVGGVIQATAAQWDAVAGTAGGLTFNTPYYLDPTTPGRLTSVAPSTPGQELVQVITAMSATLAKIAIQPPILL